MFTRKKGLFMSVVRALEVSLEDLVLQLASVYSLNQLSSG